MQASEDGQDERESPLSPRHSQAFGEKIFCDHSDDRQDQRRPEDTRLSPLFRRQYRREGRSCDGKKIMSDEDRDDHSLPIVDLPIDQTGKRAILLAIGLRSGDAHGRDRRLADAEKRTCKDEERYSR